MNVVFQHHILQQRRKEKHLTQETLAELCGCSPRYLRDLEAGTKHNPSAALLIQFVYVLDVSAEELMVKHTDNPTNDYSAC